MENATRRARLEISPKILSRSEAVGNIEDRREFASLSKARLIHESDYYWISAQSEEVKPGWVLPLGNDEGYSGRTFKGVPSIPGSFRDNKDGTFTELRVYSDVGWSDRVSVSEEAAAKAARGEGPLLLTVAGAGGHRLVVDSGETSLARLVASIPKSHELLSLLRAEVNQKVVLRSENGEIIAKLDVPKRATVHIE